MSGWLNRAKQFLQTKVKTARSEGKAQSWLSRMGNRCRLSKLWDRGVCRSVTKKEDHTLSLPHTAKDGAKVLTGLSKTNTTLTDNAATRSNAVSKQSNNLQQQDGKRASP